MKLTPAKKKALFKRISTPAFWLAMCGSVKLITDVFGIQFESDQMNNLSNGIATLLATVGIFWGYGDIEMAEEIQE